LKNTKSKTSRKPEAQAPQKIIPTTDKALVLRTDFSNEAAWKSARATIENPDAEFPANVDFVSDSVYDNLKPEKLAEHLSEDYPLSFAFVVDRIAFSEPDHPILVIDLQDEPGRTFRVIASELGTVENNLSTANLGFEDFAGAADKEGIFRGF